MRNLLKSQRFRILLPEYVLYIVYERMLTGPFHMDIPFSKLKSYVQRYRTVHHAFAFNSDGRLNENTL